MRWGWIGAVACVVSAMLAAPATAASYYGGNCALYARQVTGVDLSGNAGAWWGHAEGHYQRGHEPAVGAVLVFRPSGHMRSGHVAVVSRVVSRREVLVDQANWIRGRIVKDMSVIDASPDNDWTSVKVVELSSRTHGRENPTYGFIYPTRPPRETADRVVVASDGGKAHKAALPVRLAAAIGPAPRAVEPRAKPDEPVRAQPIAYRPDDETKAKRAERETRRGDSGETKSQRESRDPHRTDTNAAKARHERRKAHADNAEGPKAPQEKHETRHRDTDEAKAMREARHPDAGKAEAKRENRHADGAEPEAKRYRRDTRHADAGDSPKPGKTRKKAAD